MAKKEMFFSIDIETDGSAPGINSMLSIGCVAFDPDTGQKFGTFSMNLHPLPNAVEDPATMQFWKDFPNAYALAIYNAQTPFFVMWEFSKWITKTRGNSKAVAACQPTWDFHFIHWYFINFCGHSPLGHGAYCIKTLCATVLGLDFLKTRKKKLPKGWAGGLPHTHCALDDAMEQANICVAARKAMAQIKEDASVVYEADMLPSDQAEPL